MVDIQSLQADIIHAIHQATNILIVAHLRPDGDAIGSVLGMGLSLEKLGKTVQTVIQDGAPHVFRYLNGFSNIKKTIKDAYDLSIVLDCSDLTRTGEVLAGKTPDINIDHHITNLNFANINLVQPEAAATAQIVTDLLINGNMPIDQEVAEALLTGILTDTIGFRTTNVSPKTLRTAALLMEHGASLPELYYQGIIQKTFEAAAYWGKGLNKIQHNGNIVWSTLTLADRAEVRYPGNDDADLVNLLSTIEPFPIAILFTEQSSEKTKVSWRSHPGWDVSEIALKFNGGGHQAAAGAEICGSLAEVELKVLETTINHFKETMNNQESLVVDQQGGDKTYQPEIGK